MLQAISFLAVLLPAAPAPTSAARASTGEDSAWLELDREIQELTEERDAGLIGPHVRAELIVSYQNSNDEFYSVGGDDLSGTELRHARLRYFGEVGKTGYEISGDFESGSFELKDAYASWNCSESTYFAFGQYKDPLLWHGSADDFFEPFHDKTINAIENDERELGAMYQGGLGSLGWVLSAQNGVDGAGDDFRFVGRIEWDILGEGAFGDYHGAYGYNTDTQLSLAFGWSDDGSIDSGTAMAVEGGLVQSGFSLRADAVSYDEEYDATTGLDPDDTIGVDKADTTPWTVTLGYLLAEDWEILARREDFNVDADVRRFSAGLIWYALGPNGRWSLLYQSMEADDAPALEGSRIELSFSLGAG